MIGSEILGVELNAAGQIFDRPTVILEPILDVTTDAIVMAFFGLLLDCFVAVLESVFELPLRDSYLGAGHATFVGAGFQFDRFVVVRESPLDILQFLLRLAAEIVNLVVLWNEFEGLTQTLHCASIIPKST